jgi:hypothetical protein
VYNEKRRGAVAPAEMLVWPNSVHCVTQADWRLSECRVFHCFHDATPPELCSAALDVEASNNAHDLYIWQHEDWQRNYGDKVTISSVAVASRCPLVVSTSCIHVRTHVRGVGPMVHGVVGQARVGFV